MDANSETQADILAEMRTYFQAKKRGNPEHRPWHQVLSDWADRIEAAAKRERGALVAEAEAAKDARNKVAVRLRAEFAEKCMECKAKPGNAAAMRLCDELIRAAYDADICSPGDLAQRVRKIKDAIGPSQQGNAAALRDALLKARNTLMLYSRDMKPRYQAEVGFMIDDCDAALAAPARNCDRYRTEKEAEAAFDRFCAKERNGQCKPWECPLKSTGGKYCYVAWLLGTEDGAE